ncbi:transglycosylase SLT domain-containing protein [Streptomyces sp. NPDC020379]|uniref:transglycosylase SLT domain-containing protein n=1 Tax=Streptomyces sp. NPDC020379 TaxID=3365071 RepID=UPI0037BCD12F
MRHPWKRRIGLAAVAAVAAATAVACGGHGPEAETPAKGPSSAAPGSPGPSAPAAAGNQDSAHWAPQVETYAKKAGIDPQLLMAILYNESYKPHDPALERAWQRIKGDSALGIANMHKAAFNDTKAGRDFADRDWQDLPDDPALAIEAAAWHLHDLAAELPSARGGTYTKNELLALGYNTGGGNMLAFARGAKPGTEAQSYLDRLHQNWAKAGEAVDRR